MEKLIYKLVEDARRYPDSTARLATIRSIDRFLDYELAAVGVDFLYRAVFANTTTWCAVHRICEKAEANYVRICR